MTQASAIKPRKKPKGLTHSQVAELYSETKAAMDQIRHTETPLEAANPMAEDLHDDLDLSEPSFTPVSAISNGKLGKHAALALIVICAAAKIAIGAIEYFGFVEAQPAYASLDHSTRAAPETELEKPRTRQEMLLYAALDKRRAELATRADGLDSRKEDLDDRERELAVRLNELRELTERLKSDRRREHTKRSKQIEQLANVYGSMNPTEAAQLIEQLDITIALELIRRMPEKRIGQILALMSPERALGITRMLSGDGML